MKKLLLLLLFSVLLISCSEETREEHDTNKETPRKIEKKVGKKPEPKNDAEKIGLLGNVKKLNKTEYRILETNKEYFGEETLTFDEQGRIIESIIKVPKQKLYIRTEKKYTPEKITEIVKDGSGKTLEIRETFLKNEKPREKVVKNANGKIRYKEVFAYDEQGNLLKKETYKKGKKLDHTMVYSYDDGKKILEAKLDPKNDTVYKTLFQYDNVGNLINSLQYDSRGNKYIEYQYEYDEHGNLTKEIQINHVHGTKRENVFAYDDKGNPVNKLRIFHLETRKDTLITDYTYRYDDQGNWIQKVEDVNKVPDKVIERQIEYY